ncbi:MAG: hypothetical protein QXI33_02245 [Candidatus Pacearchaeota archaeon]
MNKTIVKFISIIITSLIITILIFTGPASAFQLGLNIHKDVTSVGEPAKFTVSAKIESGEIIPIDKFIFNINGPKNSVCEFDSKSNIIIGCADIKIRQISNAEEEIGYGYGYNYGYNTYKPGILSYELTLNTSEYPTGEYHIDLRVISKGNLLKKASGVFFIGIDPSELAGCSVRASNGKIKINSDLFKSPRTRFSMKIPLSSAIDGKGYLTAQSGRTRINYDFRRIMILHNDDNLASVLVTGEVRKGAKDKNTEKAVIYIYKKEKRIDIDGESFDIQHMDITFMRKCN